MRTATRFPMERIAALDRAVRAGEYPNAATIGERLGVCRRTVLRDVEFLRDRMGGPIVFDPKRNGYFYSDPSYLLPTLLMTEGELLAIVLAERVLRQYRGTPYGPDLARAVGKIAEGLTDVVTVDLGLLADSYSFRTSAPEPFEPDTFVGLASAIRGRRRVALRYWSASRDEETHREVDPYHLACVDGHWYLVGYCHLREEVRMFSPGRIRSLEPTGTTFDVPDDFKINEYLGHSFAVLRGGEGEEHKVRLRFRGEAVKYVRERVWHRSQVVEESADGEVTISFVLGHLREVERWALSWGADCTVIEPTALKERVTRGLAGALANYDPPPAGWAATDEARPRGRSRRPSKG